MDLRDMLRRAQIAAESGDFAMVESVVHGGPFLQTLVAAFSRESVDGWSGRAETMVVLHSLRGLVAREAHPDVTADERAKQSWKAIREPGEDPIDALDDTATALQDGHSDCRHAGISLGWEILGVVDSTAPRWAALAAIQADRLDRLYQGTWNRQDLDAAIGLGWSALETAALDSRFWAVLAGKQSARLRNRYACDGVRADLDAAIELGRAALDATPRNSPNWVLWMGNQANALQHRHEVGGEAVDLDDAIRFGQRALDGTQAAAPNWGGWADNQASRLQDRYARDGLRADLDAAIGLGQAALDATPTDSPDRAGREVNQAGRLQDRYARDGVYADLDDAIRFGQAALDATLSSSPDWGVMADSQANRLSMRYERDGQPADLDVAIELGEQVLDAADGGSRYSGLRAANQSNRLSARYARDGDRADLDDAIVLGQRALDATPQGSPTRAMMASSQANRLQNRYIRDRDPADLDLAVGLGQAALDATPEGSPDWAMWASNQANRLQDLYGRDGDRVDLDDAVGLGQAALDATPQGSPHRAMWAGNQATRLWDRFARDGDRADLDAAMSLGQAALQATAEGSPAWAMYVNNQAGRLWLAGDGVGAVGLWRSVLGGMPAGGDVGSRNALGRWIATVLSDPVWWVSGVEGLVGLVSAADGAVTAGDTRAGSWGPWCAGWLVEVAQALEDGRLDASAGFDQVWFDGVCDRLDPAGAGLGPVERAVRAGVVACEATRARWLSRVMRSRSTELGRLRQVEPGLADRFVALTQELAELELAGKRTGSTSVMPDDLGEVDGGGASPPGSAESGVPGGVVSRRLAVQHELDVLLGQIRGVPGFGRFADVPVFEELAGVVPAGGLVVIPVAAPGREHGWLLTLHRPEPDAGSGNGSAELGASDASRVGEPGPGGVLVGVVSMPSGVDYEVLVAVAGLWSQAVGLVGAQDIDRSREVAARAAGLQVMSAVLGWCWRALVAPVQQSLAGGTVPRRVWWIPNGPLSGLPVGVAPAGLDEPTSSNGMTGDGPTDTSTAEPGVDDAHGPSPGGDRDDEVDPDSGGGSGLRGRVLASEVDAEQVEQAADRILADLPGGADTGGVLVGVPVSRLVALSLLNPPTNAESALPSGGVVSVGVRQVGPPRDEDLEVLAKAEIEARRVAAAHRQAGTSQVRELLGAEAAVSAVAQALRERPVVHLSCHGTLDPDDPGASALELHDAALRLDEVVGWDVPGVLAVLSACQSNAAGIHTDEHLSLAAAVQLAGYAHVIGSLDPVPDTETAKLMPRLHQHLTDGADPATALHTTRTWARHRWPDQPHIWATLGCTKDSGQGPHLGEDA